MSHKSQVFIAEFANLVEWHVPRHVDVTASFSYLYKSPVQLSQFSAPASVQSKQVSSQIVQ